MTALAAAPEADAAEEVASVFGPAERCQDGGCRVRAELVLHVLFSCTSTRVCARHAGEFLLREAATGPVYVTVSTAHDVSA